ncbi:unnamed protein product [Gongylonema pulchrum]|uniref:CPSF_A domain-containing protein n=1 Tax=Gongylonema pulchrum TaxID=637853 RepID=A0A183CUY1_9BILA|nr:unnamed protein product [Gongylonema pulchrum]
MAFGSFSGLYLLVGYSVEEAAMLKESIPKNALERAGFVSGNDNIMHDIGSRLQLALERIMPPVCSPYVAQLANAVMWNEALRFELVISTVKQIRVYDLLGGLPDCAAFIQQSLALVFPILIFLRFFVT